MSRVLDFFQNNKKIAFIPAVLIGVLFLVVMVKTKSGPKVMDISERIIPVRTIDVPEIAVIPRAIGYGFVQPGQVWEAVAEVGGKIVELHPDLKRGNIIAKDTVLLRVDPAESGFVRGQSEAGVETALAAIRKLDQQEKDVRRQLDVEKGKLALNLKDLERQRTLKEQGVVTASELDRQEQSYLTQRNAVQNFQSELNTFPSERQSLVAQLASARNKLSDAQLDEVRTVMRAPFDCRVADVGVELGQAVKVGEVLAQVDSIGVSEAVAQVPVYAFREIVPQNVASPFALEGFDRKQLLAFLGISAVVRIKLAGEVVEWDGRLSRLAEAVDPQTRTLSAYVAVDEPYLKARGGVRPPLMKNMYAEVELRGRPRAPSVIVPRSAVHEGIVYVVDKENRLRRREVKPGLVQTGFISIAEGLESGETVVVSDIAPAIDGMLLAPVADDTLLEKLTAQAEGRRSVR